MFDQFINIFYLILLNLQIVDILAKPFVKVFPKNWTLRENLLQDRRFREFDASD